MTDRRERADRYVENAHLALDALTDHPPGETRQEQALEAIVWVLLAIDSRLDHAFIEQISRPA